MLPDFTFDYDRFYEKLLSASREGFQLLKERYTGETFYCFALFSHPSNTGISTTGNTEEGLTRTAQTYLTYPQWTDGGTVDDIRVMLRHNVGDFPSLLNDLFRLEPLFSEVNELADARADKLFHIWSQLAKQVGNDEAFDLVEPHERQFMDTIFAVLKQLDAEGMFGTGAARDHIVLNFLMGDQGADEMMTYAEAVNPMHIFERYVNELDAGWAMYELVNRRRRHPPNYLNF